MATRSGRIGLENLGLTWLAADKLRVSNTFRVETFEIDGAALFADFFSLTRGTRTDTTGFSNRDVDTRTDYRKIQNTIEGDYQFNKNYSIHLGYRYGTRRIEEAISGFALNSNSPTPLVPEDETETNNTHAVIAGFKGGPPMTGPSTSMASTAPRITSSRASAITTTPTFAPRAATDRKSTRLNSSH